MAEAELQFKPGDTIRMEFLDGLTNYVAVVTKNRNYKVISCSVPDYEVKIYGLNSWSQKSVIKIELTKLEKIIYGIKETA